MLVALSYAKDALVFVGFGGSTGVVPPDVPPVYIFSTRAGISDSLVPEGTETPFAAIAIFSAECAFLTFSIFSISVLMLFLPRLHLPRQPSMIGFPLMYMQNRLCQVRFEHRLRANSSLSH